MCGPEDFGLEAVADPSPAAWVGERLWPMFSGPTGLARVGEVIPGRYEGYARLLHPAHHRDEGDVTWSRVADWSGRELHSTSLFQDLATRDDGTHWSTVKGSGPSHGRLDSAMCARLASMLAEFTSTPQVSWYCVWFGWGDMRVDHPPIEITPRITASGRGYFLCRGPVDAVTGLEFPWAGQPIVARRPGFRWRQPRVEPAMSMSFHSPSFWWPEDRAWFVVN